MFLGSLNKEGEMSDLGDVGQVLVRSSHRNIRFLILKQRGEENVEFDRSGKLGNAITYFRIW